MNRTGIELRDLRFLSKYHRLPEGGRQGSMDRGILAPYDDAARDLKSMRNHPVDKTATAAAADIQCIFARCSKLDGAVKLRNADRLHLRLLPALRDGVVTLTYFVLAHSGDRRYESRRRTSVFISDLRQRSVSQHRRTPE